MSTFRDLPRAARRLIVAYSALAAVAVLVRVPEIRTWTWEDAVATAALALAAGLSEQFTVAVAHRTETENFSVTDALWVPALILAPSSVLTISVLLGTLIGHALRRWAWYKVAFNASQFVLAVTAAELVYHLFDLPPAFSLMTWVACALAMSVYFVVNELSVALIISRVEGLSLRRVVLLPGGLNLLHAAGNLTIGMLAALVWSYGPVGLPLLIAPIVLSYFAYRGWLQNRREEERRQEADRMRTLYEAGRALFGPLDASFDFQPFLQLVRRLVEGAAAELALRDGAELRVHSSESGLYLTVRDAPASEDPSTYVSARPGLSTYCAPVRDGDDEVGVLAVHRAVELSSAERAIVDALASQVSARQRNEQLFHETLEQRGHLADVVGSSSDGIFVLSSDRTVLSWNPAMERITGFRGNEVVGRRLEEVLQIHGEPAPAGPGGPGVVSEGPEPQDALIVRRDGSERWIRSTSSGMPDRHANGASSVVTVRDVTAELEADEMKKDFIATVSHELRSPLTPLKGLLQSLDQGLIADTPETRREYFEIMLRQVDRLERLINDLLDVSRIEAGRLEIDRRPIEVGAALEHEILDAGSRPDAHEIVFERPETPVWVHADQFRLGQIVSNLLSNAFKYSPEGTPVSLVLEAVDDHVVVSVRDEGQGIPLADRERVFERFYRADATLTQAVGGVGLGLYIARRLAEAMGGNLVLASRPGEGCTFSLNLPLLTVDSLGDAEVHPTDPPRYDPGGSGACDSTATRSVPSASTA